jgi:DNA-binding IclR family transcriptional regulator
MSSSWTNSTLIGSVQRALRLLDLVAEANRPMTVKALAARAGLNLGTTYNLVRTLIHEGYLRGDNDGLLLGPRFPGVNRTHSRGVFLATVRETLTEVSADLAAAAYLSSYNDGEISLIDIVDSPANPRVSLWVGLQDSAHATAFGKQILADLDHAARLDYLSRHPLAELTPNTINSHRLLLQQLTGCCDAAIDKEEYALGYSCLAVPVRTAAVHAALAISVPASDPRLAEPAVITKRLSRAARSLSIRLAAVAAN